jgi:hypothetical protein
MRALASWIGLALLLLVLSCARDEGRIYISSTPAHAVVWLDHAPTLSRTPVTLSLREGQILSLRYKDYKAAPLALLVRIASLPDSVHFNLEPRTPITSAPEKQPAPPIKRASPKKTSEAAPKTKQPSPLVQASTQEPREDLQNHSLHLQQWDSLFTLEIDGIRVHRPLFPLRLTPGPHLVQVSLSSIELMDTLLLEGGAHALASPTSDAFVEIRTEPSTGRIVSGTRILGEGRVGVPRVLLPMTLQFDPLPTYLQPKDIELEVGSLSPLIFRYQHQLHFALADGSIQVQALGHRFDTVFTEDAKHAPEQEGTHTYFGKAFRNRRPSGMQAARYTVVLPDETHAAWPATLHLSAGDSQERVFGSFRNRATLSLLLNGHYLVRDVLIEEELIEKTWPVSKLIQPGENQIEIHTTERCLSRLRVDSIRLDLGHD